MLEADLLQVSSGSRIGLLGGSFNPAHAGHIHISVLSMQLLALDQVWWLVSPQNPLKPMAGMAPLAERLEGARQTAAGHAIIATDIEQHLRTRFTADTLIGLRQKFPDGRFVWLMGADNLSGIDRWERWQQVFESVPIAVFARPGYTENAENAKASRHFARYRLDSTRAHELADMSPPVWVFLKTPENPLSATNIRAGREHPDATVNSNSKGIKP